MNGKISMPWSARRAPGSLTTCAAGSRWSDGKIVGYGQGGGGQISNTLFRLRGMRVLVEAVGYPELRPEPIAGDDFVRFTQTAGGQPRHARTPAGQGRALRED